jgi:hypothetical protein
MNTDRKEFIEGRKTFFVVPDLSLMPEEFLPSFFAKGFEVYYIMDDQHLDIASKVRVIFSLFNDVILFFNTDRKLSSLEWPLFVRNLRSERGANAKLGVLCGKHVGEERIRAMERTYLYDIGIIGGCIPLEYHKAKNLAILNGVLAANDAKGRRSSLRAICGETCSLNFLLNGRLYRGLVRDVSISHFSCEFDGPDPGLKMYEKVDNIQIKLGGIICTVNGVLFTKREADGAMLHVFVFRDSRNRDGLDAEMFSKVNGYIHDHFEQNVRSIIRKGFEAELAKLRETKVKTGVEGSTRMRGASHNAS